MLGPNGAGKSTTVKVFTTLSRPNAGSASVAGHDVLATGRENPRLQGQLYGMVGHALEERVPDGALRTI